jgi:hypothetical protein
MPEAMGVHSFCDASPSGEPVEQLAEERWVHPSSLQRAKQRGGIGESELRPSLNPPIDHRQGTGIDANRAASPALAAQHGDRTNLKVDVLEAEIQGFGVPQPGSIEQRNQGAITEPK